MMNNQFGEFKILRKLGEGGMGVVYKARMGKDIVALKTISPSVSKDTLFQKRFLREMKAVRGLNHPNIVRAIDYGVNVEQSMYFVALEFVEGESLQDRLSRMGRLPVNMALEITRQVAEGLQYAWEQQIVHRDIKPDNIMIGVMGGVKITDFGLVKNVTEGGMTQAGSILGTPLYMAPEMAMADQVDIRADIYSLGITLFHMLAGRPPFVSEIPMRVIAAHCDEPLPTMAAFNPEVPDPVVKLVEKMTAKKPEERFPSPADLVEALGRVQRYLEKGEGAEPAKQAQVSKGPGEGGRTTYFARATRIVSQEVAQYGAELVDMGVVSEEQLSNLMGMEYVPDRGALTKLLINYGVTSEESIARALAKKKDTSLVEPHTAVISCEVLALLSPEISTRFGCIPVKKEGNALYIATETPLNAREQEELQALTGCEIRGVISTKSSILKAQALHKKLLCTQCQKHLERDWKLCPWCGHPLGAKAPRHDVKLNPTIVLAEENSGSLISQEILRKIFPQAKIIATSSGKELVDLAKKHTPDVIMTDVKLPEMSGIMVCMSLRNNPSTCHIPLFMITDEEDTSGLKEKAYLAGVDELLSRPINFQEFKVKLERILKASAVPVSTYDMDNTLSTSRVMMGQLDIMGIPDLVQAMVRSGKTGTLIITREDQKGEVYFKAGRVVNAKRGDEEGEMAFYGIMAWERGKFRFRQGELDVEEKITLDTMSLLMEGCRVLDEINRGKE